MNSDYSPIANVNNLLLSPLPPNRPLTARDETLYPYVKCQKYYHQRPRLDIITSSVFADDKVEENGHKI